LIKASKNIFHHTKSSSKNILQMKDYKEDYLKKIQVK